MSEYVPSSLLMNENFSAMYEVYTNCVLFSSMEPPFRIFLNSPSFLSMSDHEFFYLYCG